MAVSKKKFVRDRGSNADEIHILKLEIYREKVNLSQNLSIPDLIVSLDIWGICSWILR